MKKFLAFVVCLLGSLQILSAQSLPSQFSAPSAKQMAAAQAATKPQSSTQASTATAPRKSSRLHANLSGSNPPGNPVSFMTSTEIAASGLTQWSAVAADFNGDGLVDIAAPVQGAIGSYAISVALSNGNGTFQPGVLIPNTRGTSGDQILFGDFYNTGKKDLIVVHNTSPSSFELWVPTGNGTFSVPTTSPTVIAPNFLEGGAVWDVNGDGNLDLVFVDSHTPANVWVLLGNGNGTFQAPTSVALASAVSNVVFADFNGDGILDLAGISGTQDTVYLGQANGTFVAGTPLANPDGQYDICNNAAGVLTPGGQYDIVSANCSSGGAAGNLTVYVNNGNGTFKTGVYYASATETVDNTVANISPLAVSIADVNGDGNPDVIVSNHDSGDITVLLGNGNGTLNVPTVGYNTGGNPRTSAIVQDFNGDGIPDIVVPDDNLSFIYMQGYGDGSFRSALDFFSPVPGGYSAGATTIATGDFNGDGIPDLVVGNNGYNPSGSHLGITVFLSNPNGSMQPGINLGTGGAYQGVTVADFNGDGNLDIAAVNESNNGVQIYFGDGNGGFSDGGFYPTGGTNAVKIIAADFNGDGHPDLAVLNAGSTNVSVLLNNGDGTFGTASTYANSAAGTAIATADVNGDGILDLVVPQGNQGVDVFLGSSTTKGTFQPALTTTLGFNNLGNLALGDLNGDGKIDLAVTVDDKVTPNEGIAVAEGNGNGTFGTPILVATTLQNTLLSPPNPGDVKMFDLKGNGWLDLIYSNSYYGTVGVLYNTGTNAFASGMFFDPVEYAAGSGGAGDPSNVMALALADVNHDGAMDVAAIDYNYAGVTILLNASGNSNSLVSSANPSAATESVALTATLAATVRGVTAVPTGTVTFMNGSTSLGTATLNNGVATMNAASLAVGPHNITAQYSGDANFSASTSTALSQLVTLAADATALGSSLNPAGVGQSVSLSATVSPRSTGVTATPTGNVTFSDGSTVLGSVAVTNGVAHFVTSSLAAGTHTITAQYAGDANFAASTSSALSQSVVAPDFALGANNLSQTVNPGSSAEYTISVTPSYGYSANISFSCPASLPSKVTCSFSPASLSASGGKYPTTTLTLTTTAASTASLTPPVLPNSKPADPMLLASLGGFGLFGLVFVGASSKRNRLHMAILGFALLITMFALVGCGGSSSSNNNNSSTPGTPAGQYTVMVTATGSGNGAPSHAMNVTLNVQ